MIWEIELVEFTRFGSMKVRARFGSLAIFWCVKATEFPRFGCVKGTEFLRIGSVKVTDFPRFGCVKGA